MRVAALYDIHGMPWALEAVLAELDDNEPLTTAITPDEDLVAMFGDRGTFVIGHTHHQFERRVGGLRVINAGSVGMAYEDDVAAYWTLVEDGEPRFMRTPFDVAHAVERVRASDWPQREEFVAENLLAAVPRDEAIAHFESQR